ncbi:extracellular solute-binding protein [Verrucomicrobium sp. BvORR034]|uniref:ABC transporter substrate-binding protein n=1 Tax=Verrucomicrobium sp. BvORR034 TaxID=1396418 RepID=UPI000679DE19|nr:extracellular solute-binding protein [Verrucomicrobium sp. BvORR034]
MRGVSKPQLAALFATLTAWWERFRRVPMVQHWGRELAAVGAILVVLAAPFLLKPAEGSAPREYNRRLVIYTPHHEKIRYEFGRAFAKKWKDERGETLYVDWRVAGTSEIALMMRSDYAAAFERYWTESLNHPWLPEVATSFGNSKVALPKPGEKAGLTVQQSARKEFLDSAVGIGVDLFFGGGAVDYESQARAGFLVAADASGQFGLKPVMKKHPEWFQPQSIPQSLGGESYYDKEARWVGTCLSSLGICFNRDVLARLGIEKEPVQWQDLGDPRYFGQVALADPNKSGTVTKAFEQLIQQQMQQAIDERRDDPNAEGDPEKLGIEIGWERGVHLIQRISANSRYFTDNATKIPLEVSQGDAAAGMCIDFYGWTFEDMVRRPDGTSRMGYITPLGGTSMGVDPIGMLRGAPEPEVAAAFMEFVLSDAGQKLWNFSPGTAGGPVRTPLRRLPVRLDFYNAANRASMTDPHADPMETSRAFTYHPEWTNHLFGVVRYLVKVMCVDTHEDQRRAWEMLISRNFPPRATAVFEDTRLLNYQNAQELAALLQKKDKIQEARKATELSVAFRNQYRRAYQLAKDGF